MLQVYFRDNKNVTIDEVENNDDYQKFEFD
jgi:hypothetical protein